MKLNKRTLYVGSMLSLIMAACSADVPVEADADYGLVEINLNGGIASSAKTKAALHGMINGKDTWADNLTVSFARADAVSNVYSGYQAMLLAADVKKEADATTKKHQISFSTPAYYQSDGQNTKLIGWYPVAGNSDSFDASQHKVTFAATTMDGETDYMVTGLVEGNKVAAARITSVTFSHLLMQLSVKAYAEDASAQSLWGGIKSVAIKGLQQKCEIILPAATVATSDATAEAHFTNTSPDAADLPLVKKNFSDNTAISYSDVSPLALDLASAGAKLAGYAMFAPQGNSDISLIVETESGGIQYPVVNAPTGGFLAGYSYEVLLKFGASGISPAVTIKDWVPGSNPGEIVM